MKKVCLSVFLGISVFMTTYLCLCYFIPGWRIKLEAEPIVYFVESLRSMALLKCLISGIAAVAAAAVPYLCRFWRMKAAIRCTSGK